MPEKLLTEMNYDEMSSLIDRFIDRTARQSGEMPANSFFALLFANLSQRIKQTFEVEGRIVNGQLVLVQPSGLPADFYVQNNQIVIGERRIIVKLRA